MDGREALKKIRSEEPDMVLLDLIMPEKNGFEVLEEMKKDKALKNIPVIVLSNLGQESDVDQGKKLGAVDYLIKSNVSIKEVIEVIKLHLAK